jgi:hypothetical protein
MRAGHGRVTARTRVLRVDRGRAIAEPAAGRYHRVVEVVLAVGVFAIVAAVVASSSMRFGQRLSEQLVRRSWLASRERVVVRSDAPGASTRLRLSPRPEHLDRARRAASVRTRDEAFDAEFLLEGEELVVLAVMSHDVRAVVGELSRDVTLELRDGVVTATLRPHAARAEIEDAEEVVRALHEAAVLAELELPERLVANLEREQETEVALRVFELLVSSGFDGRFVFRALDVAMRADEPRLRIRGAARSGDAGRPILQDYARDVTLQDRVRAEALRGLVGTTSFAAPELVAWLASAGPLLTESIAEHLGELPLGDGLEDALLSLAAHHGERVRVTAIRALARHGAAKAFTYLFGLASDPSTPRTEKLAALAALEHVGSRIEGSGAGQLSLVDGGAARGHVSLAPAERGALSFDPDAPA